MKWFICKNTTLPHDPRIEQPIEVREVAERDMKAFTDYCVKNNLHAYGESYKKWFDKPKSPCQNTANML